MRTFLQVRREEIAMIAAHRRAWLDELAAIYPERTKAAEAAKIDRSFMVTVGNKCGHKWPRKPKVPKPVLTESQSSAVRMLIGKGYKKAEAVAIVTAPRVKVSARLDRIPAAQPRSEAPEARKAFPRMTSAASMKRPCAGENMGAMR